MPTPVEGDTVPIAEVMAVDADMDSDDIHNAFVDKVLEDDEDDGGTEDDDVCDEDSVVNGYKECHAVDLEGTTTLSAWSV